MPDAATFKAPIETTDTGGFVAVASTRNRDRDGDVLLAGAFDPLPAKIPVHMGHDMRPDNLVATARPYYDGGRLMIDARYASTTKAQTARQLVREEVLDTVSIVFRGEKWETRDGVRTLVKGELLACDLVSIPSNRDALVLSSRGYGSTLSANESAMGLARAQIVMAEATLELSKMYRRPGRDSRQHVDRLIREALDYPGLTQRRPRSRSHLALPAPLRSARLLARPMRPNTANPPDAG